MSPLPSHLLSLRRHVLVLLVSIGALLVHAHPLRINNNAAHAGLSLLLRSLSHGVLSPTVAYLNLWPLSKSLIVIPMTLVAMVVILVLPSLMSTVLVVKTLNLLTLTLLVVAKVALANSLMVALVRPLDNLKMLLMVLSLLSKAS